MLEAANQITIWRLLESLMSLTESILARQTSPVLIIFNIE
jgi:hypothetical protein